MKIFVDGKWCPRLVNTGKSSQLRFCWVSDKKADQFAVEVEIEILTPRKKRHFGEIFPRFALHLTGTETLGEKIFLFHSQNLYMLVHLWNYMKMMTIDMKSQNSKLCYKQCEKGKVFLCLHCKWKEAITSLTNLVKEPSTYRVLFNWNKKLFRIKSCIFLAELCWVEILKYKLWNMDISTKCWDSKEAIGLKLRRRGLASALLPSEPKYFLLSQNSQL